MQFIFWDFQRCCFYRTVSGTVSSNVATISFLTSKQALAEAMLLVHTRQGAPTRILVYASNTAVGAILHQQIEEDWVPLAFFSQKLQPTKTHYGSFGLQLFPVYMATRHIRHFLEGQASYVMTGHKPHMYAFRGNHTRYSAWKIHHWHLYPSLQQTSAISEALTTQLRTLLSRVESVFSAPFVSSEALAAVQAEDEELSECKLRLY